MIDTHAHLDACDGDPHDVLARATEAGVTRVVTIGTGIDSCRRALAIAEGRHPGVVAALGIDPHLAATAEAARVDELRRLLGAPKVVAVGETGLDGHHGADTLREQRALFEAHLALADELGLPVVIHSRAASAETAAALVAVPGHRRPALLLGARPARARARARLLRLVRRERHLPQGGGAPRVGGAGAARADPRRDRQPLSRAATGARASQRAGHVRHTSRCSRRPAGRPCEELELQIDGNATAAFRLGPG